MKRYLDLMYINFLEQLSQLSTLNKYILRFFFISFMAFLVFLTSGLLAKVTPFEVQKLLPPSHPIRTQYEDYLKKFDDGQMGYILIHKTSGQFNDEQIYDISDQIIQYLKDRTAFSDIVGPSNAKYFKYNKNHFQLEAFFNQKQLTTESKEKLKTSLWKNFLINENQSGFLISFSLNKNLDKTKEKYILDQLSLFLDSILIHYPKVEHHQIGSRIASAAFLTEMSFNIKVITPLLLLLIGVFFFIAFRSMHIVAWSYYVMIFCYLITLVLIVLFENGLGPYSNFALMFSFIVATSDLIQFFGRFQNHSGTTLERLTQTWKQAYTPCLLTSLTTGAGFVALIINDNLPIRYFGFYCAFACLLEWLVIFYLLPALLILFNFESSKKVATFNSAFSWYLKVMQNHYKRIVGFSLIFIVTMSLASFFIYVDDNFYTKFKETHPLSKSVKAFTEQFQFVGSVDLIIELKQDHILAPTFVKHMTTYESEIRSIPQITKIQSLMQLINQLEAEIKIGNQTSVTTDNLTQSLFDLMLDYGVLKDLYNPKANQLRTTIFLDSLASDKFNEVYEQVSAINEKYKDFFDVNISGFASIRHYINSNVIKNFFESFALSFFLTFLCFIYLYKNVVWAFLALLPNALPLLVISGPMGLFNIPVDSNLAILICVAFGISGDNTMHLVYVIRNLNRPDLSYFEQLKQAIHYIGTPIIATSAAFLFCLPVFLLGNLKLFSYMAIFLSLSFIMAFFSDLFSFPALHLLLKKRD